MTMKRLFRQTSTLILRTALLLGAMILVNTQTKAQTAAQWAEMPDAFETMDPASIIGDGNYYYIQFYTALHDQCSYLTDCGVNEIARSKDFLPYAYNRLWTLVSAGETNQFKLKNKAGHYLYLETGGSARVRCTDNSEAASTLKLTSLGDGYDISAVNNDTYPIARNNNAINDDWQELICNFTRRGSRDDWTRLRFAKLKSTAAFIIYYRGDADGAVGNDLTANATTTRHYLTYSGTGNESPARDGYFRESEVSTRRSIIPSDKPLCTLPTLAAYHQDGLWTLEGTGVDGQFYIKKYGSTDEYLNLVQYGSDVFRTGVLGVKDNLNGNYTLVDRDANRYTLIQNVKYYETSSLAANMFYNWTGYGANPTQGSQATVNFNTNHWVTAEEIASGYTLVGTGSVDHQIYADLTNYSKMIIRGDQNMQLRVLMNRQESNSGYYVERDVTIGNDGTAVVDLTGCTVGQGTVKMTYTNADAPDAPAGEVNEAKCGYNKISSNGDVNLAMSSYGRNFLAYLQVDASAINGTIKKVTLTGDFQQITDRALEYGVGYSNIEWSSTMTWSTTNRAITRLGGTQSVGTSTEDKTLSFDITGAFTDSKVKTIMLYCLTFGGGYIKNPKVYVEYEPNDASTKFVHLNAIKTGWSSPTGTVTGIGLMSEDTGDTHYLHHAKGDGWQLMEWSGNDNDYFFAGFYPVEVPVPNQDDFYGVLLKVKRTDNRIKLTGQTNNPTITPLSGSTLDNLYGATFTPTDDFTNVFQFKNMPTGCYTKIVIKFGSPVPDKWHIHTYGGQYENNVNLSGLTQYEVNLNGNPISDFTIFNWDTMEPITITECYFYPENPDCDLVEMLNHDGGTDAYSNQTGVRKLWHLEQVDDYGHFRLKNPNGQYFQADGVVTNDANSAKIFTNTSLLEKFDVEWYYFDPAVKEIPVNHRITHKMSYLQQYAQAGLDKQGLATDTDTDWKNADQTQKTNHFEITHYVKRGKSLTVEFPTVLNYNNDHVYYQRFYHYNDETCDNGAYPDGTDINGLKNHVSLDVAGIGDVQYYLYLNGIVTGEKLNWDGVDQGSFVRKALRNFKYTNTDGKNFTVAADVSRYSDFAYQYPNAPLTGNLVEPSLTMRYLYFMKDAKVMAKALTGYPEQEGVTDKNEWKETGTVCIDDSKWYETKIFHFPATPLPYENEKWAGYRGEFIGLRHVFSDYWVFNDGNAGSEDDNNLISAVNDANDGGKIEVRIYDPNGTGIRLGGWNPNIDPKGTTEGNDADYQGFYFYDKVARNQKTQYGDSRFIVFRYPRVSESNSNATTVINTGKEAYIHVYLNNNGTRYQLAQFTVIFDANSDTRPWISVNNSAQVKNTDRDPDKLREIAGNPIAKITFDYPNNTTYRYPASTNEGPLTRHNGGDNQYGTIGNSSPIPLKFDNTNYAFDGDGCNWGSYAMVTTKWTQWGNGKTALPASDAIYGYNVDSDKGLQSGFLYIDASEQPGDICSADFQGEFCAGDKLMCSGWISGSNRYSDNGEYRCPGGITLTVKGERIEDGQKETIYRFCPGQCYELDNGDGIDGSTNVYVKVDEAPEGQTIYVIEDGVYVSKKLDEVGEGVDMYVLSKGGQVVWQQFYFEFGTTQKYKRYWMEVNNNCVSSNGGDFMLDNVEVFALVPEVIPEMNTPICIHKDASEMQLLKLNIGFDKILAATSSTEVTDGSAVGVKKDISFVFLEKDLFLAKFLEKLNKAPLSLGIADVEALEKIIEKGDLGELINTEPDYLAAYKTAFNVAVLGDINKVWDSDSNTENLTAAVLNYHWSTKFTEMETFSFAKAVNGLGSVFRETDTGSGERFIVINGNYPNKLPWKTDTDYYVIPYQSKVTSITDALYEDFNICSACCKKTEFKIDPPIQILSMEASDVTEDLVVCEGKIPTLLTNLKGYNINGELVPIKGLNFDWWLGNETDLATLDNYHEQKNSAETVRLDEALYILRLYYPDVTSLDGVKPRSSTDTQQPTLHASHPALTQPMIDYLKSLVDAGQLILHQSSISVLAKKADGDDDPYFYLVACPIHDAAFEQALNYENNKYVAYFCDEPQGLRIKVGEKAPSLKCGFVPNENGFSSYDYSSVDNAVLSIRLAKKAQFENVKHGTTTDSAVDDPAAADPNDHFLWLPIRDAEVQSTGSTKVIQKSDDYNVYLASTDDPIWDKEISKVMNRDKELPIFGKIVKLEAVNKSDASTNQTSNRLCIYFIEYGDTEAEKEKYDVREGYSYTLSLPFKENGTNTCDGTILINVKIVPDYEVWTGGAGNTDWNNDQNWRRADGNLATSTTESTDGSARNNNELLVSSDLSASSPLKDYTTNYANYRTAKDRILRKGFAPLYCTHVLMKSNEWGDAPVLYDALDGANSFTASPFPNLRDTSTPILKFDMQARHYEKWSEVYGGNPDKGRTGDLIAEMYQINSCDEIAFQPGAELRNAHLLNYNNAWVEYKLDMKRWYLLGSPLQGTIAGEWYAPTGTAQQKTTYYENVTFGEGYDRYSPAIYQRSWDKAKAVLYEVGANYSTADNPNDLVDGGSASQGAWNGTVWNATGADDYLDRLGYKPMDGKKANVAIKGVWSNTYNDATVDYAKGGFSVMVMNHLKGSDGSDGTSIIRLPKEDTMYDYYKFEETGAANGGTDTYLSDTQENNYDDVQTELGRALNRGRLKTDLLLPTNTQKTETAASKYGDARTYTRVPTVTTNEINNESVATLPMTLRPISETVSAGISNLGYYLVENPFPCGLNMEQFFTTNTGLEKKYWLLTATGQHLVQRAANGDWITQTGEPAAFATANAVVAPGQGFFVQATTAGQATTITFNKDMQAQSRYGEPDEGTPYTIVVGTKQVMKTVLVTYDDDDDPETAEVPLMVEDENNPGSFVKATMEVPEVDNLGNYVVEDITEDVTIYSYKQTTDNDKKFSLKTRGEVDVASLPGLVITAKRDNDESSALVMQRSGASNDFLPSEDTEAFITSDFENVPTVYTLCGRLATTINSIHDFRSLPIGVESTSDAPCTLTFRGVEMLGDSIAFYDAVEQKLTPLESGMAFKVSGQTQNRYYLVRGLNQKEAAEETHLQIFTEGLTAKVIASTAEPIVMVRCFDTAGRLIYSAEPQTSEYSFSLPRAGVYIIEAQTEKDRKTRKVIVK